MNIHSTVSKLKLFPLILCTNFKQIGNKLILMNEDYKNISSFFHELVNLEL